MTAATLTQLPIAAGSAVLASAGRAALWALSHYMRAPLTNTAILSMVSLTAIAGSNALYFQEHKHPAPLFAPYAEREPAAPRVEPVVPATRPVRRPVLPALPPAEATGSVTPDTKPIGNAEVFELQRKLQMLELFNGTIDGYYGPQTARAIKKFEERNGMKPKGELTNEILEAVRKAPSIQAVPVVEALPAAEPVAETDPMPEVTLLPTAAPAPGAAVMPETTTTIEPLPAPEPLPMAVQAAPKAQPVAQQQPSAITTPMGRELPETPQEAFNLAVATAGDAIDTIIDGVQTVTMSKPLAKKPVAVQRFAPDPVAEIVRAEQEAAPVANLALADPVPVPGKPLVIAEPEPAQVAEVPVLDTDARPEELVPAFSVTDPIIVAKVQRGLASLGFLHGPADGVAGEATAKAIRNFEVYYNYRVTGRISPELLDLLVQNGASI